MSLPEIFEEILKLTESEKLELWQRLDEEIYGEDESEEFLAELDAAIAAADAGGPTFTLEESKKRMDDIIERHKR